MGGDSEAAAFLETLCQVDETGHLDMGASIGRQLPDSVEATRLVEDSEAVVGPGQDPHHLEYQGTLGQGGMGLVRLAKQRSLGRHVAVKSVRSDRATDSAAAALLQEAWVMGAVEHPNTIPVHDLGFDDAGHPIVIMKRVRGVEWADLLHNAQTVKDRFGAPDLLDWNLSILLQVMNAVRFAHSRQVVHRDLKPANVMIGEFGEVYLVDWGLAVSVSPSHGPLPRNSGSGTPAGTPGYMAPEMLRGDSCSTQTDVYLLGGILYEIASKRLPHDAIDIAGVVASIKNSPPTVPPNVPSELAAICTRAMASDPKDRYADLDEMQRALREFLAHRGSAELARRASQLLDELSERTSQLRDEQRLGDAATDGIYSLFSECRFAFREALAGWPDNPEALVGLREALCLMIELELDSDAPTSANNLLSELDERPADLAERVAASVQAKSDYLERLGKLSDKHNVATGWLTRTWFLMVVALVWLAFPLVVGWTMPEIRGHYDHMAWASVSLLVFTLAVLARVRGTLLVTDLNRRLAMTVLFVPVAQLILTAGAAILDLPERAFGLALFLWFILSTMFAISTSPRLFIMAAGYLLGFFVAAYEPSWAFYAMAASNFVMALNVGLYSVELRKSSTQLGTVSP